MRSRTGTGDGTDADGDVERRLKVRAFVSQYRTGLAIAFVLVLVLGGWVSYGTYVDPATKTERRVEHRWTAMGTFSHGATVTESTAVHDAGTDLENEPLYYTAATPEIDGAFHGGYEADRGENVTVDLAVDLRYRAVGSDGTVYWSDRERLASTSESDVAAGELVPATFTLNVSEVTARIAEIEADLGPSPGETEIALELNREIEGAIDGEYRTASDRFTVDVEPEGAAYRFEEQTASYDDPKEETETVTVPASYGPARTVGGPLALLVGLGGLVGLRLATDRLPELTPAERAWLAYREDRSQFDEVITTAELPPAALETECAAVGSLADLAAFGIDVGAAVVFDRRTATYVVRHDGVAYVFEPPTLETTATAIDAGDDPATGEIVIERSESDGESAAGAALESDPDADPDGTESDVVAAESDPTAERPTANAASDLESERERGVRPRSMLAFDDERESDDGDDRSGSAAAGAERRSNGAATVEPAPQPRLSERADGDEAGDADAPDDDGAADETADDEPATDDEPTTDDGTLHPDLMAIIERQPELAIFERNRDRRPDTDDIDVDVEEVLALADGAADESRPEGTVQYESECELESENEDGERPQGW